MKTTGPVVFCCWDFLITASISLGVIYLFRLSDSSWFGFERFYVPRNLFISSRLSSLLAYSCSQYFLTILCISLVSVVISLLSFVILFIGSAIFFSWWVWLKVCQSCLSFWRTSSWIYCFCIIFLDSIYFIYFCSDFIISFHYSLWALFVVLFQVPFTQLVAIF